ncbi:glycosyltransferase family 4 protein [Terrabacter sp. NPDC080008]|uniref:glycosyltransferase family 4 protein n=1 Tax=Terrabacter sp. NPDC080008 TaxID=3155176 RepID=UPI00344BDCE2
MTDALPHQSRTHIGAVSRDAGPWASEDSAGARDHIAGSAALRIAVVGPTGPDDGAAAGHTTMLAHHLDDAGHEVTLVSWADPSRRREGVRPRPAAGRHVPSFPRTIRALVRTRPDSWLRAGRRLRGADVIVVVQSRAELAPAHLTLLRAAHAVPGEAGPHPRSVVVILGELPLDSRAFDRRLVSALLSRVHAVLVDDPGRASVARALGASHVSVLDLPRGTDETPPSHRWHSGRTRLLALGRAEDADAVVGVTDLLRAMGPVPGITLTIAGQLSGSERELVGRLAADPELTGRVEVREGTVPSDELATLLAEHDVLALPFRSAADSRGVLLGHAHGLPVLAPDLPPFSAEVTDGVDGVLVPADDDAALTAALQRLGDPELRRRLAEGVRTPDLSGAWAHYLGAIEALSVDASVLLGEACEASAASDEVSQRSDSPGSPEQPRGVPGSGSWGSRLGNVRGRVGAGARQASQLVRGHAVARAAADVGSRAAGDLAGLARGGLSRALSGRRALVTLRPDDLPHWVLATDVLGDSEEADDARRLARIIGLPRSLDSVSAWAALGTLAAVLRVRDDGRRSAVIVDEGGPRSLLSRWARAVGFAPVEIDFTGEHPSVAALDVDAGSLDVIARIHPGGCDGDDVDHVLEQASWALRSGGLLVVTIPLGPRAAEGAVGPADVRGVLARAHDLGFVLVGDLDGDVNARMRQAASRARADDAAYALVRLTLRRR